MTTKPKPARAKTLDREHLVALRNHYQQELERVQTALLVFDDVARFAAKTARTVEKVRARVAAAPTPPLTGPRGGTSESARNKALAAIGARPKDRLRRVFAEAGDRVLSREELLQMSGFESAGFATGKGRHGQTISSEGVGRRVFGLSLASLVKAGEVKKTRHGFSAWKLQPDPAAVSNNGATA